MLVRSETVSPTNVELYEALEPTVGEAGAKMIAEVVPPTRDLATKGGIDTLAQGLAELNGSVNTRFAEMSGRFDTRFAGLDGRIHAEGTRTIKWLLGFFVPVWLGTWGTVVAVLLKS